MSAFDDLYQEIIMDHYRSPRGAAKLDNIPQAMADWILAKELGQTAFLACVNVLLLLAEADPSGAAQGQPFVALDMVGAGEGEVVLVVDGSWARRAAGDASQPVDAVIVGIFDTLRHDGQLTYKKS